MKWIRALRPHHWIKNVFVLGPAAFSLTAISMHQIALALVGFAAFSIAASSIYIFNDVRDRQKDASHPKKCHRPIAAGQIRPATALVVSILLAAGALTGAGLINIRFGVVILAYVLNNVLYTLVLKEKVIADVMSIAIGFMLRLIGGAYAIDVPVSRWLLICGFSLSLVLAFGKRRSELVQLEDAAGDVRPSLLIYNPAKLDLCMSVMTSLCILTYMLFTTDPETVSRHGTDGLIYTTPIVIYCLLRYMFKAMEGAGGGPVEILLHDRILILGAVLWALCVVLILYTNMVVPIHS